LTHKFLTRPGERWSPSGRYGLSVTERFADAVAVLSSGLGPAHEQPLTKAQALALASYAEPFAAEAPSQSWSPKAPLIDATAGGRFQGWRVP
jgi:hypothetical protein